MTVLIENLAIAGYRSFGEEPQYFDRFEKINILIGQNNSGKSNILRFLSEIYPVATNRKNFRMTALDKHLPSQPQVKLGIGMPVHEDSSRKALLPPDHILVADIADRSLRNTVAYGLGKLLRKKSELDGTSLFWTLLNIPDREDHSVNWAEALRVLDNREIETIWSVLTQQSGGNRKHHWEPDIVKKLLLEPPVVRTALVPAIRQIGRKGSESIGFEGNGIIEKLAKLQNPDVHNQKERVRFNSVRDFLRDVIDNPDANIEIPYERDTILVHMNGHVLPIESLGTGLHEVLILASAATILENHVICMEEPELHLNPILQRKLLRYLTAHTTNQYFITTHSAALMDTPGAEGSTPFSRTVIKRLKTPDHALPVVFASVDCESVRCSGTHPLSPFPESCIFVGIPALA